MADSLRPIRWRIRFPTALIQPTGSSLGLEARCWVRALAAPTTTGRKNIRNFRWSFGFQQEICTQLAAFEVNYVGQRARDCSLSSTGSDSDPEVSTPARMAWWNV